MKHELLSFLAAASQKSGALLVQLGESPAEAGHGAGHNGGLTPESLGLEPSHYAFWLAMLSCVSMPIGAILGLKFHPDDHTCSGWIAVGAGALLFAVSIELYGHAIHDYAYGRMDGAAMVVLMTVSLFGAMFFTWVTRLLEGEEDFEDAGFPDEEVVCRACETCLPQGSLFCLKCGARVQTRAPYSDRSVHVDTFLRENSGGSQKASTDPSEFLTHRSGSTDRRHSAPGDMESIMESPGTHGDLLPSSLHSPSRTQTFNTGPVKIGAMLRAAKAQERDKARRRWKLLRQAFQTLHIIRYLQRLARETRRATRPLSRTGRHYAEQEDTSGSHLERHRTSVDSTDTTFTTMAEALASASWTVTSSFNLHQQRFIQGVKSCYSIAKGADGEMTEVELENMHHNRTGALKMYAMLVIDGVPEGILMGFLAAAGHLSITLVLSFLVANFPEAFAGGVLMEKGGLSRWQIAGLWGGLMVMVGAFAGLACELLLMMDPEFTGEAHVPFRIQVLVAVMEGLAGGAMMAGIAGTMLPEAYERRNKSGWLVASGGFLCTVGFLTAVAIKITLG